MESNRSVTVIQRLRRQVETIMRDSGSTRVLSPAMLLLILAKAYGAAVGLRAGLYRQKVLKARRLPCKVIAIGNLTVGGTGKTPLTLFIARQVQDLGLRVGIVSRGYKGTAERSGGLVSDGRRILMSAAAAGDEPYMLATSLPGVAVAVGRNRFAAGMQLLQNAHPQVVILDDAFQHMGLERDLNILLLDYAQPFGNHQLLPRGTLREPLTALGRADVCILTRCDKAHTPETERLVRMLATKPVLRAYAVPFVDQMLTRTTAESEEARLLKTYEDFQGRRVFLFSGLADNLDFKRTITQTGAVVTGAWAYSDHHFYSKRDLDRIAAAAVESAAELLVTTSKDFARIAAGTQWPLNLVVVGLNLDLKNDHGILAKLITDHLALPQPAGARPL
jgi:tetraacyldisaccharide 4'-kinase